MPGVNEARFLVQHKSRGCECRLDEIYVIQSKTGIFINFGGSVRNQMIGILVMMITYSNPSAYDSECNKECKIDEYLST